MCGSRRRMPLFEDLKLRKEEEERRGGEGGEASSIY
jgi:hypothetical protein